MYVCVRVCVCVCVCVRVCHAPLTCSCFLPQGQVLSIVHSLERVGELGKQTHASGGVGGLCVYVRVLENWANRPMRAVV